MKLCFNGFCLGPRPRAVGTPKATQTVLLGVSAVDTLNITTFFNKSSEQQQQHHHHHHPDSESASEYNNTKHLEAIGSGNYDNAKKVPAGERFKMIDQDDLNYQNNNLIVNNNNSSSNTNDTIMFSHNENALSALAQAPPAIESNDSENNNHLITSSSQAELVRNDLLNNAVDGVSNIYIQDCVDVNMQDAEQDQQLTSKEKDLIKIIQIKDVKIKELEEYLNRKDEEIANLKSHLDKFQSVFPFRSGAMGTRKIGRNIQKQRVGISAEPQSQSSMHELLNVTFPKYEKEER